MSNLIFDMDNSAINVSVTENINESTGKKEKTYKISGIFSTIGEKNRNGRTYPRNLWESNVKKYQTQIENGTINTLMEYEHPPRSEVDPMKAVSKITKLWIEGKYVMGEAIILNNDSNEKACQLKSLIDNGVKISVSSRGVGNVGKDGIVEDFELITYDVVPNPSDFNATMNGICESYRLNEGILEGKTFSTDNNGNIIESFDKDVIRNIIYESFEDILKEL